MRSQRAQSVRAPSPMLARYSLVALSVTECDVQDRKCIPVSPVSVSRGLRECDARVARAGIRGTHEARRPMYRRRA
ncbi:hypothetical protein SCMU_10230 [Sinomonas cyclohexanicum]|uniref:Uncharacterized protein n=1 Tax=Sinomonas cyclohexanicum TaxID=322009 RepID=A0ABM7PSI2_SINCY|nr:hypothetical protein SCMU_10230 [Corynebacterium cyclohexanicum]